MANADVLKEFMVKLVYSVDEKSQKKFVDGIASATRIAVSMGKAVVALSAAVAVATAKIGQNLDDMYFSAQRSQAAVASIKAMTYAVSQLGGSAQGALSSMEAFGAKLRQNPGYESLVKSLGVVTRNNGKLRDTVSILQEVADALKNKPYHVAFRYAQELGLDESTFRALQSGELTRHLGDYRRKARELGIDQNEAAKRGNEFMSAMRALGATLELIGQKMAVELLPSLTQVVQQFDQFLQKNADTIVEVFRKLGEVVMYLATAFGAVLEFLQPVASGFNDLAKSMTGQDGVTVAFTALGVLIGVTLLGKLASLLKMVTRLRLGWLALAAVIMSDVLKSPEQKTKEVEDSINSPGMSGERGISGFLKGAWNKGKSMLGLGGGGDPSNGNAAGGAPRNKTEAAKESYQFWRGKGLTHAQALGVVANEMEESAFNPRARGDGGHAHGLYQWHSPRRRAIAMGSGIDVSTANAHQQREAAYWESTKGTHDPQARQAWRLIKEAKTPGEAAAIWSRLWERPAAVTEAQINRARIANGLARQISPDVYDKPPVAPKWTPPSLGQAAGNGWKPSSFFNVSPLAPAGGDTSVNLNQKTEITVMGGTDPMGTANAVAAQQKSVNSGLTRNVQGAVR